MVNRPKKIGTTGESAVVKLLRNTFGFPEKRARRVTLNGTYDLGDVHAEFPIGLTVVIEVKSGKQADEASLLDIAAWQQEAIAEARAANGTPLLIVKRRAYSPDRVESWRAFLPLISPAHDRDVWVEMPVRDAVEWLGDLYGRYPVPVHATLTV